jgi:hydroxypyruvate isomerase
MSDNNFLSRRAILASAAGVAAAGMAGAVGAKETADDAAWKVTNGRINQSVVPWCFKPMPVEELAHAAAKMGLKSVELSPPSSWPLLKKLGLTCAIASSHGFVKGWNHTENHAYCAEKVTDAINAAADFGCPNVITFSGMRGDLMGPEGGEIGKKNMVAGLKKVLGLAEKKKVTLAIEMLNSRVDIEMKGHPGYQCDSIEWAADVCDRVGSPRVKILFDIYHVQIMQGDVITRLRQFKDYIAHYHTAGNPGRNELTGVQEINYPGIMQAIVDTGYQGYVGQEFIPTQKDMIASLREGVRICDV